MSIRKIAENERNLILANQIITSITEAIKELIDNSLDAKSSKITIHLENYGRDSFTVNDNGHGMNLDDLKKSVLFYYTSKIENFTDETALSMQTLGFRGEALAAIAILSEKILISTKSKNDENKYILIYPTNSTENQLEICHVDNDYSVGTSVHVKNLFLNKNDIRRVELVKSYRKYLKNILIICYEYAIARKKTVDFKLHCNQELLFDSSSFDTLEKLLCHLMNIEEADFTKTLININIKSRDWMLYGYISSPKYSFQIEKRAKLGYNAVDKVDNSQFYFEEKTEGGRKNRNSLIHSLFIVNGRPVDTPKNITKKLDQIYKQNTSIGCGTSVLFYDSGTTKIDVNQTTDKRKIYFESEKDLVEMMEIEVKKLLENSLNDQQLNLSEEVELKKKLTKKNKKSVTAEIDDLFEKIGKSKNDNIAFNNTETTDFPTDPDFKNNCNIDFITDNVLPKYLVESKIKNCTVDFEPQSAFFGLESSNSNEINSHNTDNSQHFSNKDFDLNSENNCCDEASDVITDNFETNKNNRKSPQILNCNDLFSNQYIDDDKINSSYNSINLCPKDNHLIGGMLSNDRSQTQIKKNIINSSKLKTIVVETNGISSSDAKYDDLNNLMRNKVKNKEIQNSDSCKKFINENVITDYDRFFESVDSFESNDLSESKESSNVINDPKIGILNNNKLNAFNEFPDNIEVYSWQNEDVELIENKKFPVDFELKNAKIKNEMFLEMSIIGIYNKSFIVCEYLKDIYLVDQHAADEKRIFEYLNANTKISFQPLIKYQKLKLSPHQKMILKLMNEDGTLENNGYQIDIIENEIYLKTIPIFKNFPLSEDDLIQMISLHDSTSLSDKVDQKLLWSPNLYKTTPRPPRIWSILAMKACRSAIKFGEAITIHKAKTIVHNMAYLEHPWNCPHGRPTYKLLIKN